MTIRAKHLALSLLPERLLLGIKKRHYARTLRTFSHLEERDLEIVSRLVKEGDQVVDIGANVGAYTKCLSEFVGETGHVLSIEPVQPTFFILEYCVKALRLQNVQICNRAISDAAATLTMEVPPYDEGGENFYQARIVTDAPSSSLRRVHVEAVTLDSLVSSLGRPPSFVKCDVEGHELSCIRGATETIGRSRPAWLIEVSGDPDAQDSAAAALVGVLKESGYEMFWFDGTALRKRGRGDRSVNYFFLTPQHLRSLREKNTVIRDPLSATNS
ncbi:MAG TPA: FkbM family methyltransferase [Candidatus Polarisedimenticolaceae bacterium]|nr:FkbM family methyltransferase [Candidatus Polarisedimenticolaceae bacterium]